MKKIDLNTWDRKTVYDFMGAQNDPYYTITFAQDVTDVRAFCKRESLSFYLTMCWLCTKALNTVENFRYVVRNGEVWLSDMKHPSFTDLDRDSGLFRIVTAEMTEGLRTFVRKAAKLSREQSCFIDMEKESDELYFFSCVPGIRMRGITSDNDRNTNTVKITWGSYEGVGNRLDLLLHMEINHMFVDGVHIQRFAENLTALTARLNTL